VARVGDFFGAAEKFGFPLSVVHPTDNKFPQFDPQLDAQKGLSDKQKRELQDQINELFAVLQASRDYRM
jgi:hypothetical protein